MGRSYLQYLLICALAVNTLTVSLLLLIRKVIFFGPVIIALPLFLLPIVLAIGALWLIVKGKALGIWFGLAHFALQFVTFTFSNGTTLGCSYGLAFNLTFGKNSAQPVTLNLTALFFSVCCIIELVRLHDQSRANNVV